MILILKIVHSRAPRGLHSHQVSCLTDTIEILHSTCNFMAYSAPSSITICAVISMVWDTPTIGEELCPGQPKIRQIFRVSVYPIPVIQPAIPQWIRVFSLMFGAIRSAGWKMVRIYG